MVSHASRLQSHLLARLIASETIASSRAHQLQSRPYGISFCIRWASEHDCEKKEKAWKIFSRVFLLIFRLNGVSLTPHTEASLHRISLILKIFSRRNWILSRLVLRLRRKRCCVVVAIMFISRSHKFVCLLKRLRAVPALAEMYHSIGRKKLQFFLFPRQFYSGRFMSSPNPKELTQKWQLIYHCPLRQGLQLRNSRWKRNKRAWISENERHTR